MAARPGPVVGQRIYEDFTPVHELAEGESADTLVIYLTGFKKEQIKIQIDNYGKLRISGERPMEQNKWIRFRKEVQVPENCNMSEIRAKFDNSRVYITLPKLVLDQVPPRDQTTQTTQTTTQDKPAVPEPKLPSTAQNGPSEKTNGEQREEKRSEPPPVDAQKKVEDKETDQSNEFVKGASNAVREAEPTKEPEREISAPAEEKPSKRLQIFKKKVLESAYDSRKAICSAFAVIVISVGVGLIISYNLKNHTMEHDGFSNL